MGINTNQS